MKNFALFAGEYGRESGGMQDLIGRFDSIDEAVKVAKEPSEYFEWFEVVDISKFALVHREAMVRFSWTYVDEHGNLINQSERKWGLEIRPPRARYNETMGIK